MACDFDDSVTFSTPSPCARGAPRPRGARPKAKLTPGKTVSARDAVNQNANCTLDQGTLSDPSDQGTLIWSLCAG
eukprot:6665088-Prymnesium_polylepis.1